MEDTPIYPKDKFREVQTHFKGIKNQLSFVQNMLADLALEHSTLKTGDAGLATREVASYTHDQIEEVREAMQKLITSFEISEAYSYEGIDYPEVPPSILKEAQGYDVARGGWHPSQLTKTVSLKVIKGGKQE
jgi:hypothetical protein